MGLSCRDNALRASTGPLDDRLAAEIDGQDLEGRVAEIEAIRCPTSDLSHADLPDTGLTECERFLDGANHHDAGCPVRQGDGSGGEGAEYIDDCHRAECSRRAVEKAVDRDFHHRGDEAKICLTPSPKMGHYRVHLVPLRACDSRRIP